MKNISNYINEQLNANDVDIKNAHPKTMLDLRDLITSIIESKGNNCDLNDVDISNVTEMDYLFYTNTDFNGDISKWDVSHVTDMRRMFNGTKFNGDISKWDVSHVTDMGGIFEDSKFNGDISKWNVSNVKNMNSMLGPAFNGDISKWDVSHVTTMDHMFSGTKFNGDISKWDVSHVTDMMALFANTIFNQDISKWDVSNVENMDWMFYKSKFDRDISNWNVSKVKTTANIFKNAVLDKKKQPKFANGLLSNRKSILDDAHIKPRLRRSFMDICEFIGYTRELESNFMEHLFSFCEDNEVCEPEFKTKNSLISFVNNHRNDMVKGSSSEDIDEGYQAYYNVVVVGGVEFTFPSDEPIFTTRFKN